MPHRRLVDDQVSDKDKSVNADWAAAAMAAGDEAEAAAKAAEAVAQTTRPVHVSRLRKKQKAAAWKSPGKGWRCTRRGGDGCGVAQACPRRTFPRNQSGLT